MIKSDSALSVRPEGGDGTMRSAVSRRKTVKFSPGALNPCTLTNNAAAILLTGCLIATDPVVRSPLLSAPTNEDPIVGRCYVRCPMVRGLPCSAPSRTATGSVAI